MNHRFLFRLLLVPTLVVGLGATLSGASIVARQEKAGTGTATQSKASTSSEKTDAVKDTTQAAQDAKPAQSTATQAPEPTQNGTWGPYEVISSIEFGVRGIGIHGNGNKFRSDQNYDPGFRLFDASLLMRGNGTGGVLFDELMINTFGWGNDPNRYLRVNATRTDLWKFDAVYRRIDYFNSLTNFAAPAGIPNSQHTANTQYRQGDFDLTLWPARQRFRLNLGYSLDFNSGPSVTTSRYSSDEFPVLAPVSVYAHDYRIGFDSRLWIFDISFLQGWRFFKEDTTYFIDQQQPGNNTTNTTVIDTYQRDVPTRGKTPYTRFSLHTLLGNRVDFTGRYIYSSGSTDYIWTDVLTGTNSSNRRVVSDAITIAGNAKRPNAIGDLSATVLVMPWLRISDTFRVQTFRINGGDFFNQVTRVVSSTPLTVTNRTEFETTNYRRYSNLFEVDFDLHKRLSFHLGYRYTDRHIERLQQSITAGSTPSPLEPEEFDNRTNSFIFGLKAKPLKMWTIYFDLETGENDNVFTRTANYDYTSFRARSIVRLTDRLSFNGSVITRDNTNPTVIEDLAFGADINTRIFSGSADWTASEKLNLSGGYTYFHITSETIVQFNTAGGVVNVIPARYFMRDHFAFLTAYWQPHRRFNFYGAYRIHNDQGQGDRLTTPLVFINSYPYQISSPEFKFSVNLHRNVDWIAGYQYIDYKEQFANNQFYQAHLPYTSLRLYIGRPE
jgi:hypothetical protein